MRPNIRKGTWDQEEDDRLKEAVQKALLECASVSKINWQTMADTVLPSRTGKACWERWIFRLDPSIDRSPFTAVEDDKLLTLQQAKGNKWAAIAKCMCSAKGTRTADQVKSRFISLKRLRGRSSGSIQSLSTPPQLDSEYDLKRDRSTSSHLLHTSPKHTKTSQHEDHPALASMDVDDLVAGIGEISIDIDSSTDYVVQASEDLEMLKSMDKFLAGEIGTPIGTPSPVVVGDITNATSAATSDPSYSFERALADDDCDEVQQTLDSIFGPVAVHLEPPLPSNDTSTDVGDWDRKAGGDDVSLCFAETSLTTSSGLLALLA